MVLVLLLLPLAAAMGTRSAGATAVPTGLRAMGSRIVDGTGTTVVLRGVNRSGSEYACIQGWGIFEGPTDDASLQAIKAWKTNSVRVPLNEGCWLNINGAPSAYSGAAYHAAIREYVDRILANGLTPILELHWSGAGTTKATGQQPMMNRDHSVAFWRQVATAYRADTGVIFDLHNEPYPDNNGSTDEAWRCWRDGGTCAGVPFQAAGMQEVVNAVRATGAKNLIMLGGLQYANTLTKWVQYKPVDPENNLAASWHTYNFNRHTNETAWNTHVGVVTDAGYPLVAGEVGVNNCDGAYFERTLDWLDARGASYLGWVWNLWGTSCSSIALVSDYAGTPTPYGQLYRDHLSEIAAAPTPTPTATPASTPSTLSTATPPSTATATPVSGGTATPTPTPAPSTAALVLYDNAVNPGFWDGSFSYASKNACDTTTHTSASCSYAIAYGGWGGINFGKEGGFSTAGYSALEYTINTHGQPLTNFSALLGAYPDGASIREIPLSTSRVVATLPNGWVRVAIPVSELNPNGVAIYTVQLKNATANALATIHVDDIRFTAATAPPAATPTPVPATPTPVPATPTPAPATTALVLYDNAVNPGFRDGSFSYASKNACDATTHTSASCSYAIAYGGWGGINLDKSGGFSTAGYRALEYTINTHGQPLTNFSVLLTNQATDGVIRQLTLSSSRVVATLPNGWVRVAIPVSELNPNGVLVGSVQLKNATNRSLPTIHVDDIRFTK